VSATGHGSASSAPSAVLNPKRDKPSSHAIRSIGCIAVNNISVQAGAPAGYALEILKEKWKKQAGRGNAALSPCDRAAISNVCLDRRRFSA